MMFVHDYTSRSFSLRIYNRLLLGSNKFFSTLFSNTLSLWSSFIARYYVSHKYKRTKKYISIYSNLYICR